MSQDPPGWTFSRVLGLIIGLIFLVGFGVCSVWGLFFAFSDGLNWDTIGSALIFVLPGLGLTWLSWLLIRTMVRQARSRRSDNQ